VAQVAAKVKIYEIAKSLGISSTEMVEICQRAGFKEITHHSNAVSPEQADELRKTAIKLYKPKQPALKRPAPAAPAKAAPPKAPAPKPRREKPAIPSTRDVKPVPPPAPKGTRRPPVAEDLIEEEEEEIAPPPPPRAARARKRKPVEEVEEDITKRTIVFKRVGQVPQKRKEERVEMESPVTVRDLSTRLGIPANEIIKELMFEHGMRANINATLEDDMAQLIGLSHGVEVVLKEPRSAEDLLLESLPEDKPEDLEPRPPVVAMLGHVDHGKTSILDRIRHTNVAGGEAGGITQDTAAWQVESDGHRLTFVDTPGHEAFTAMRARGAQVTDIVVLVVAADDGVMPQTMEAIDHARAAEVPIVVAVNKIDKPDANPMRVRQQLASYGLNPEEWGGEVGFVNVSATTGEGIDDLLERITLEAELLEVKANPSRRATGAVLEARMEPGLGAVTDVIVQNGTLRKGDLLVCGSAYGTVRALYDDRGREVAECGPGQPVSISGLNQVPEAGDPFIVVDQLDTARKVAQEREAQLRKQRLKGRQRVTLENLYESIERGEAKQLNVIIKADVQGTLDPLVKTISEIGTEEASLKLIHSGVGNVSSSDVVLAEASDAIILAFRVHEDEKVREMALSHGVEVLHYDVIYDVTDHIRAALEGLLEPERREERVGRAEVRQLFYISRFGTIAGCYVTEGAMRRNCRVRVLRGGKVLHESAMLSLRQGKNDAREVVADRECGINVEGFNDFEVGDTIECFNVVAVKRTLTPSGAGESRPG
jgi:translation initiation factor IF-2